MQKNYTIPFVQSYMVVANLDCKADPINKIKSRGQGGSNTHLTKSGQNEDLWTFCDHDEDIGRSWQVVKFLKIIFLKFF